jgi:predicted DNA-binding transcriptional regulator AlpA
MLALASRLPAALLRSSFIPAVFANSEPPGSKRRSEPPGPERFITDLQLAARWHVAPSTIWRNAKKSPDYPQPVKLSARVTRFRLSDVERLERKDG